MQSTRKRENIKKNKDKDLNITNKYNLNINEVKTKDK